MFGCHAELLIDLTTPRQVNFKLPQKGLLSTCEKYYTKTGGLGPQPKSRKKKARSEIRTGDLWIFGREIAHSTKRFSPPTPPTGLGAALS